MNKLLSYINALTAAERQAFARDVDTSIGYLRKAVSQGQQLGAELCVLIEKVTGGKVTRKDLRPNNWARTWPELADARGAKR